ncbi:hypothetical protein ACOME3_004764 [Neoechinorhynchus agilis]
MNILPIFTLVFIFGLCRQENRQPALFSIEGSVLPCPNADVLLNAWISIDDNHRIAHFDRNGRFVATRVSHGSHIVRLMHPDVHFQPIRVDISTRGKYRVRRANILQQDLYGGDLNLPYPVVFDFKSAQLIQYEQKPLNRFALREILMNPMVLMMVVPVIILVLLPKLIEGDPQVKEDLQSAGNLLQPRGDVPDLSEIVSNWFGGNEDVRRRHGSSKKSKPN